jgi:hypothetical protein
MISLDTLPAPARQVVQDLQAEVARQAKVIEDKDKLLQIQDEKIRLLNLRLWGPKGEKLSPAQTALLFEEASVTAQEVQTEAARPVAEKENPLPKAKAPRPNHPGRHELPQHLERREQIASGEVEWIQNGRFRMGSSSGGFSSKSSLKILFPSSPF